MIKRIKVKRIFMNGLTSFGNRINLTTNIWPHYAYLYRKTYNGRWEIKDKRIYFISG